MKWYERMQSPRCGGYGHRRLKNKIFRRAQAFVNGLGAITFLSVYPSSSLMITTFWAKSIDLNFGPPRVRADFYGFRPDTREPDTRHRGIYGFSLSWPPLLRRAVENRAYRVEGIYGFSLSWPPLQGSSEKPNGSEIRHANFAHAFKTRMAVLLHR